MSSKIPPSVNGADVSLEGVGERVHEIGEGMLATVKELGLLIPSIAEAEGMYSDALNPLTPTQFKILRGVSLGATVAEQSRDHHMTERTVDYHRYHARQRLGALSMPHAVRVAIETGVLPIEVVEKEDAGVDLDPKTIKVISLISHGLSAEEAVKKPKSDKHKNTINYHIKLAKQALGAKTRPHIVRRAFEERSLALPDNKLRIVRGIAAELQLIAEAVAGIETDFDLLAS